MSSLVCLILLCKTAFQIGKMKRGKRDCPLWFMPNNTCFSVSVSVLVCLCLCVSACVPVYSGQLLWSRYPSQLNPAEQNRAWQLYLWHSGFLWLQSWVLPVWITCTDLSTYWTMGQTATWMHRLVSFSLPHNLWKDSILARLGLEFIEMILAYFFSFCCFLYVTLKIPLKPSKQCHVSFLILNPCIYF